MATKGRTPRTVSREGERGFLNVMADAADPSEIAADLGERWEMLASIHKPYPCGIVLNPVVDGCPELRGALGAGSAAGLASITLHGHPLLRERADRPAVRSGREAQVSTQHAVAACLTFSHAGIEAFSDAAVANGRVQRLRQRVRVIEDPAMPVGAVRIIAEGADGGGTRTIVVERARGTDARPMSDAEIEEKTRRLAAFGAPGCERRIDELIDRVWTLDEAGAPAGCWPSRDPRPSAGVSRPSRRGRPTGPLR